MKKSLRTLIDTYLLIIIFTSLSIPLFYNQFNYNYTVEINNHFRFFSVAIEFFLIFLLLRLFSSTQMHWGYADLLVCILLISITLLIELNYKSYGLSNEVLIFYLMSLMLYFFVRELSVKRLLKYLPLFVTLLFFLEVFIGISQIISPEKENNLAVSLNGTMINSGIYSIYLVASLPPVFYTVSKITMPNILLKIILNSILIILVLYIITHTVSRTAIVLLIVFLGCYFYFAGKKNKILQWGHFVKFKIVYLSVALCALFAGVFALIFLKYNSFNGRLLIWKISLENWREYVASGVGIGNFSYYYSFWQMKYVRDNKLSHTALLNLDDSKVAFNEYIQFFAETGILGIVFILYLLNSLLKLRVKDKELASFHFSLKMSIVLILIASLSSYPFHCNAILFLFFICTAALVSTSSVVVLPIIASRYYFIVPAILIFSFLFFNAYRMEKAILRWTKLSEDYLISNDEKKDKYYSLYAVLEGNGKFLLEFGEWLSYNRYYSESIEILEKSKTKFISERTFLAVANSYELVNNYAQAIYNMKQLSNLVPYKIVPKSYIMKLYFASGDTLNGKKMAWEILSMPVKVQNPEVDKIMHEIRQLKY